MAMIANIFEVPDGLMKELLASFPLVVTVVSQAAKKARVSSSLAPKSRNKHNGSRELTKKRRNRITLVGQPTITSTDDVSLCVFS